MNIGILYLPVYTFCHFERSEKFLDNKKCQLLLCFDEGCLNIYIIHNAL